MKQRYLLVGWLVVALACASLAGWTATLTDSTAPLEGKGVFTQETTLGNLVADALRQTANAELALVNASQMRPVTLPAGAISDDQVPAALAYPDEEIALVRLKGATVLALLERGLSVLPQPNKGFLQVSGLVVRFDSRRAGGSRIVEAHIGGQPLVESRDYKVALPLSLAKGSGGYFTIMGSAAVSPLGTTQQQAVSSFLSSRGTASARADSPRLEDLAKASQ